MSRIAGLAHRDAREARDVGGARVLARRVEPVGPDEVRVAEPQRARLVVHLAHERVDVAASGVRGERVGGVVRALDQAPP